MCPFANSLKQLVLTDFRCGARKQAKIQGHFCTDANRRWISSQVFLFHIMSFPSSCSTSQTEIDNWVKGLSVSAKV